MQSVLENDVSSLRVQWAGVGAGKEAAARDATEELEDMAAVSANE